MTLNDVVTLGCVPRRDRRRFGPGPYVLGFHRNDDHWRTGFPFDVPAVAAVPRAVLGGALEPVLSRRKPRTGYFLRAESFFNIAQIVDSGGIFAPDLSLYGNVPLHGQSHGESFLALAANRFGADGFYVLDEPEAALSVPGSLALLAIVVRAARLGAQFVIASHSPILLAIPDARVYELGPAGFAECEYDDLDAVRLTRGFLESPDRYLRAALQE